MNFTDTFDQDWEDYHAWYAKLQSIFMAENSVPCCDCHVCDSEYMECFSSGMTPRQAFDYWYFGTA